MHVAINRAFHRLGFIDITLLTSLLVQASTVYGSYLDSLGEAVSQEATSDLQHATCKMQGAAGLFHAGVTCTGKRTIRPAVWILPHSSIVPQSRDTSAENGMRQTGRRQDHRRHGVSREIPIISALRHKQRVTERTGRMVKAHHLGAPVPRGYRIRRFSTPQRSEHARHLMLPTS